MALDQLILDILGKEAKTFNETHAEIEARVSSGSSDFGREYVYDVQLFLKPGHPGKHVLRISHSSPGPSFPVMLTFADPAQPSRDAATSPDVLADKIRVILSDAM